MYSLAKSYSSFSRQVVIERNVIFLIKSEHLLPWEVLHIMYHGDVVLSAISATTAISYSKLSKVQCIGSPKSCSLTAFIHQCTYLLRC